MKHFIILKLATFQIKYQQVTVFFGMGVVFFTPPLTALIFWIRPYVALTITGKNTDLVVIIVMHVIMQSQAL